MTRRLVLSFNLEISKGFGFLSCPSKKVYQKILELKTAEINGRVIEINQALDKSSPIPQDIRSKGLRKLFVGGLSDQVSKEHLSEYFTQFGKVLNSYIIYDPATSTSKHFGYVEFETLESAEKALAHKNHKILGKVITLESKKTGQSSYIQYEKRHAKVTTLKDPVRDSSKTKSNSSNSENARNLNHKKVKNLSPMKLLERFIKESNSSEEENSNVKTDKSASTCKRLVLKGRAPKKIQSQLTLPKQSTTNDCDGMHMLTKPFRSYLGLLQGSARWLEHCSKEDNMRVNILVPVHEHY